MSNAHASPAATTDTVTIQLSRVDAAIILSACKTRAAQRRADGKELSAAQFDAIAQQFRDLLT